MTRQDEPDRELSHGSGREKLVREAMGRSSRWPTHGRSKFVYKLNDVGHAPGVAPRRADLVLSKASDIAVFVSPARLEIFSAIGLHEPVTAAQLATHLGRSVTSLYHHLAQLVRVGAVAVGERRRDDGKSERTYSAAVRSVSVGGGSGPAVVRAQQAAGAAALRLTARELAQALADPDVRREGRTRELVGIRARAWFGSAQLRELDRHVRAIEALLQASGAQRKGTRAYAVSVVLAPAGRPRRKGASS
jgi:predicted ArsR family transcriptional regulator